MQEQNFISIEKRFLLYLRLEKQLSPNTLGAYKNDIEKLFFYLEKENVSLKEVQREHLSSFMASLHDTNISTRSRSRILSGIRAFFKFLLVEEEIEDDPTELLESPKMGLKLPFSLSVEEIDKIIDSIDLSNPLGQRNRTIIETLFSCGLRVSEAVDLKISNIHFEEQFIQVIGKGNKQRLVPISERAIKEIKLYLLDRNLMDIKPDSRDILFLNRRGGKLTRVMILIMVKKQAKEAGIQKVISPHTFRHSFATALLQNGANLRVIQQMLGHENISTTEVYTHLNREDLKREILEHHPRNINYHQKEE